MDPISAPQLILQANSAGNTVTGSQYIVNVIDQRGMGLFQVFQVLPDADGKGVPIASFPQVAGSSVSVTLQASETGTRQDRTFTLTLSEP